MRTEDREMDREQERAGGDLRAGGGVRVDGGGVDEGGTDTARFVGYIVGIDDAGPYEIFGDTDEPDDTPEAAFYWVHGFWEEVDLAGVRSPHIRVWDLVADEVAFIWVPENPGILAGFYTDEEIEVQI